MDRANQRESPAHREERRVHRRRVLYISGFDPRGAAHYHRFLRDEAAKHVALTGEPIDIGPRRTISPLVQAWTVSAGSAADRVETEYEFLRWDDIVRKYWPRGSLRMWGTCVYATWTYLRAGVTAAAFRASYPIGITTIIPGGFILGQVLLIALAGGLFLGLVPAFSGLPWWSGIIPVAAAAAGTVIAGRSIEKTFQVFWSGRIGAFTIIDARRQVEDIDARRDAFADRLLAALESGQDDEILLVGHSLGTPLAVSALALALERNPDLGRSWPAVSLLTIGPTTPMLSLMPEAEWFRRHLRIAGAAAAAGVSWTEFSAPPDGACFALIDPVVLPNPGYVRPEGSPPCPRIFNARFMELMDPATYAEVKRDWTRMHFQYLMAGDRLGRYDYFKIIAGPLRLQDRYADSDSIKDYSGLRMFSR
jgi:pimeloyl-ACP methyl ester carboxylesterase